jgi:two-component system NarL family response regulator
MTTADSSGEIRILVADDHRMVRQGITALLGRRADLRVVAEASTGDEAMALYRQHQPDVTLMDLRMPGIDGIQTITSLRAEFPRGRFIVLTTYDGDEDVFQAIRAGAQGYLLKGMSGEDLIEAIRAVHAGRRWFPAGLAEASARAAGTALTERETDVLRLVVAGKSNKEIASALELQESTVKSYLTTVFGKLGVASRTQAIVVAVQRGLARLE